MGTPYKLYRNTNARIHVRRDSNPHIPNKKYLLECIVLRCAFYKSIHFIIQLEQCLTPKSPCIPIALHHLKAKNPRSTRQQPQYSKLKKFTGAHCAPLCKLYKPIQFRIQLKQCLTPKYTIKVSKCLKHSASLTIQTIDVVMAI
jgi:hypothetical protein